VKTEENDEERMELKLLEKEEDQGFILIE